MSTAEPADGGTIELEVGMDGDDCRLDVFLAETIPGLSRSRAQRAIQGGDVLVNGSIAKASLRVRTGDRVEVDLPEPPQLNLIPEPMPLDVVFEDETLIVINKAAGVVVHPGAGINSGTLANGLLYRFGSSGGGPSWRPGIVHRIDKDTSGLLVVARTEAAHSALSAQFHDRTVAKRYVALVHGRVGPQEGRFDKPIGRHPQIRVRMAVRPPGHGRPALTLYRVLERFPEATSLDVEIRTGRTHQIRVHLADAGHPVIGDETYGKGRVQALRDQSFRRGVAALGRHFLHASFLGFDHPATGARVEFSAPLPAPLAALLESCRERAR